MEYFPSARRPVRLQRFRSDARANVDHRARCRILGAALGSAHKRAGRQNGDSISSPSGKWETGGQAHEADRVTLARIPSDGGTSSERQGTTPITHTVRIPFLRSAMDNPRQSGDQSTKPDALGKPI